MIAGKRNENKVLLLFDQPKNFMLTKINPFPNMPLFLHVF